MSSSRYDVTKNSIVRGEFEEHGVPHHPAGLSYVDGIERHINLAAGSRGQFLGFNIRGGSEYGLGIYVSKYV